MQPGEMMWHSKCSEASVAQTERCEHCSRFDSDTCYLSCSVEMP